MNNYNQTKINSLIFLYLIHYFAMKEITVQITRGFNNETCIY